MTYPAQPLMTAVPAHLVGTRAALFYLLRSAGQQPVPAEPVAMRPVAQVTSIDRVRAALQADVFVFAKSA